MPLERDFERIRFVTERYRQLQGLHLVAWSGPMSIYLGAVLLTSPTPDALQGLVFVLAVCVPAGFAQAYLRTFYAQRFGRIGSNDESLSWAALMLAAIALTVVMSFIERLPTHLIVAAVFTVFAGFCGWQLVRDFPFRRHLLIGILGAAGGLTLFWMPSSPTNPTPVAAVLVFHLGMTIVGLLDHRLLVRTLGGLSRRPEAELADG